MFTMFQEKLHMFYMVLNTPLCYLPPPGLKVVDTQGLKILNDHHS